MNEKVTQLREEFLARLAAAQDAQAAEEIRVEYLGKNGSQTMFQSEFVGIPLQAGAKMTMNDVGLFVDNGRLVLVLQDQTTPTHLAMTLTDVYPVPQGARVTDYGTAANYRSCGPYRVESVTADQILLTPNPNWTGAAAAFEQIACRGAS